MRSAGTGLVRFPFAHRVAGVGAGRWELELWGQVGQAVPLRVVLAGHRSTVTAPLGGKTGKDRTLMKNRFFRTAVTEKINTHGSDNEPRLFR